MTDANVRWLAIDASTYTGTAAIIAGDGAVVASAIAEMRGANEERLMPMIAALLEQCVTSPTELAGVICGKGPGSFTSLRIAAAIAKGIAHGAALPLVPVSSLLLTVAAAGSSCAPGRYLSVLNALRGEHYATLCVVHGGRAGVEEVGQLFLAKSTELGDVASELDATLAGPDQELSLSPHALGASTLFIRPHSLLAVDSASWEPLYGRLADAERLRALAEGRAAEGQA